ncbi:hypothetical protein Slin15195_G107610 [Septoria linicola]|uniref:Uncharacterized protein n=1 Tax=Septoria linicola TaxID=215465 RepID=A0A9Q9AWY7_9PEZI|nr:hypothetical protein Slin15195_G107610 [Septoria linicola]
MLKSAKRVFGKKKTPVSPLAKVQHFPPVLAHFGIETWSGLFGETWANRTSAQKDDMKAKLNKQFEEKRLTEEGFINTFWKKRPEIPLGEFHTVPGGDHWLAKTKKKKSPLKAPAKPEGDNSSTESDGAIDSGDERS